MTRRAALAALLAATALLLTGYSLGRSAPRPSPNTTVPESAWTRIGAPSPRNGEAFVGRDMTEGGAPTPESAPSRTPGHSLTGIASWYDDGPGLYAAAGPALRVGHWRGRTVIVCGSVCLRLPLSDWCGCYGTRVIDLSREAFRAVCGDPAKGLCRVRLTWAR